MMDLATESVTVGTDRSDLQEVDIHDVLSNERRQLTLDILAANENSLTIRELSELVAERETGEQPPPRNKRQSAYVSLQQTHLPKLDKLGIIDYDTTSKRASLTDRADRVVGYMDDGSENTRSLIVLVTALVALSLLVVSRISGIGVLSIGADLAVGIALLVIAGLTTLRLR